MCSGQETVEEVYKILRTNCDPDWYLVAAQDRGYIVGSSTGLRAAPLRHAYSLGSPVTDLTVTAE